MSRFVFSRKNEPELPPIITPELARIKIRVCTDGYPETGSMYYEGDVRTFVIERLPHPNLIALLPRLLSEPQFTYRPSTETLVIFREA